MGNGEGARDGRRFCEDPGSRATSVRQDTPSGILYTERPVSPVCPVFPVSLYGNLGAARLAPFFGIFGTIAHCLVAKNADNADGSICASALTGGWTRFCATIWTG